MRQLTIKQLIKFKLKGVVMQNVSVIELINLLGKSQLDVVKALGVKSEREAIRSGFNLNYKSKEQIITAEIISGKVQRMYLIYPSLGKVPLGTVKYRIKLDLIKAGFKLSEIANKTFGVKDGIKTELIVQSSPNRRKFELSFIAITN